MERTVGFVAVTGPLQWHALRHYVNDIQPGLNIIDCGHAETASPVSLAPVARPPDSMDRFVVLPPINSISQKLLFTLNTPLLLYFIISSARLTGMKQVRSLCSMTSGLERFK